RVSNPVRSPRFRASASVTGQGAAFATGVPPDLYAFHRYTGNSAPLSCTQPGQFPVHPHGRAVVFHTGLNRPPTRALRPLIPDNARPLRITAPAGTSSAGALSFGTVKRKSCSPSRPSSRRTELYNPRAVLAHAALLRQACAHCGRFPTAASRRSLGRVSVPVWPITLSGRLRIVALVSRYLTNQLMRRGPIRKWQLDAAFPPRIMRSGVLSGISPGFPELSRSCGQVTHV